MFTVLKVDMQIISFQKTVYSFFKNKITDYNLAIFEYS